VKRRWPFIETMAVLRNADGNVEVLLALASGKEFSVSVTPNAKVSDVCQAAQAHLQPGQRAKCAKGDQVLDPEDAVEKHLPGPWQAVVCVDRKELIFQAQRAGEESRYKDMVDCMRIVAQLDVRMMPEECKLLSTAYTSSIGHYRSKWKAERDEQGDSGEVQEERVAEIGRLANEVLDLLTQVKSKAGGYAETELWCIKMTADYRRYLAEVAEGEERATAIATARASYEEALPSMERHLRTADPLRLGMSLNYSVFLHDLVGNHTEACRIARNAFEDVIAESEIDEDDYKNSCVIMQNLRDNLTLWTQED